MLIKNLYKIESFHYKNQQLKAEIFINKEHEIFKGHFPNNPVMPGVCMIQIIKELTEKEIKFSLSRTLLQKTKRKKEEEDKMKNHEARFQND